MKLFTIAQVHQVEFFTQISRQQDGWAWTQANVAERDGRDNVHDGCCYQAWVLKKSELGRILCRVGGAASSLVLGGEKLRCCRWAEEANPSLDVLRCCCQEELLPHKLQPTQA